MDVIESIVQPFIEPVKTFLLQQGCDKLVPYSSAITACIYLVLFGLVSIAVKKVKKAGRRKVIANRQLDLHPFYDDYNANTAIYIETKYVRPNKSTIINSKYVFGDLTNKIYYSIYFRRASLIHFFISRSFIENRRDNILLSKIIKPTFFLVKYILLGFQKHWTRISSAIRIKTRKILKTTREDRPIYEPVKIDPLHTCRFFLVLADTGMGKTTFLINLFIAYTRARSRKFDIKLFPLSDLNVDSYIEQVANKPNTILLLDALDEDSRAMEDYYSRLRHIESLTKNFRRIIITCRTQFFTHEDKEPKLTSIKKNYNKSYHRYGKIYISNFDYYDIKKYLHIKFPNDKKKYLKALSIVMRAPDVMIRPMILKNIDDFVDEKKSLEFKYDLYEVIVEEWLEREQFNIGANNKDDFKINMNKFSSALARYLYENRNTNRNLSIPSDEVDTFAKIHNIPLNSLELKVRSLLTRKEEDNYYFSHRSIMEFFLAKYLYTSPAFRFSFKMHGFLEANNFYIENCLKRHLKPLLEGMLKQPLNKITFEDLSTCRDILQENLGFDRTITDYLFIGNKDNDYYGIDWKIVETGISKITVSDERYIDDVRTFVPFKNLVSLRIRNCRITKYDFIQSFYLGFLTIENCKYDEERIAELCAKNKNLLLFVRK